MNKPPQLLNGPEKLMDWFRENTAEGERSYEIGMNVRCIELDGGQMRDVDPHDLARFWRQVSEQLPKDAIFMQWCGQPNFLLQKVSVNRYYDSYIALLASKEWPVIDENQPIPLMGIIRDAEGKITLQEPQ